MDLCITQSTTMLRKLYGRLTEPGDMTRNPSALHRRRVLPDDENAAGRGLPQRYDDGNHRRGFRSPH